MTWAALQKQRPLVFCFASFASRSPNAKICKRVCVYYVFIFLSPRPDSLFASLHHTNSHSLTPQGFIVNLSKMCKLRLLCTPQSGPATWMITCLHGILASVVGIQRFMPTSRFWRNYKKISHWTPQKSVIFSLGVWRVDKCITFTRYSEGCWAQIHVESELEAPNDFSLLCPFVANFYGHGLKLHDLRSLWMISHVKSRPVAKIRDF